METSGFVSGQKIKLILLTCVIECFTSDIGTVKIVIEHFHYIYIKHTIKLNITQIILMATIIKL